MEKLRSSMPKNKADESEPVRQESGNDFSLSDLENHIRNMSLSDNYLKIVETREKLRERKAKKISFSNPVLSQNGNPVFFPHTINVIQGQAGVHKSRIAEIMCSAMLKTQSCQNKLLGFKRNNFDLSHKVVYVDTERNLSEQLPYALQTIQINAGYQMSDNPESFDYISLLEISRDERFTALNEYLKNLTNELNKPLFIVLDVSTDCIADFNRTSDSMKLIDLMNIAVNKYNVIFLCLIHENPKSDKARGHFGTELMNKASTLIQVAFEKDSSNEPTDLIRVKYLKCRTTKKQDPFYVKFSDSENGLVLAEQSDINSVIDSRRQKAGHEELIDFISLQLGDGSSLPRPEFVGLLKKEFNVSQRTIEERIKQIVTDNTEIFNSEGHICNLVKEKREKSVYYRLEKIDSISIDVI